VFVSALICLLIIGSLAGTMLQSALVARRQLEVESDARQAELLLQAGLDRARVRLANEPDYRGETWKSRVGGDSHEGQVKIVLMKDERHTANRIELLRSYAQITAEFPLGSERSVRRSQEIPIQPSVSRNEE